MKNCSSGYYSEAGAHTYTICPKGFISNEGSSKCTICPAGTYETNDHKLCKNCSSGYYSKYGAHSCSRCVDIDGDGKITDKDQTKIGKGKPDWTFGMNVNAEWKGIDFNKFWQGTAGNDIYDATMRVDRRNLNLPSWMLDRWTGEGTSNEIPGFVIGNNSNLVSSDLYVHSGSYLRLKNISLEYTLQFNGSSTLGSFNKLWIDNKAVLI